MRIAFLAVLALLVLFNVAAAVRNQHALPCKSRVCDRPRDLEHLATSAGGPKVASGKAVFLHLARRIPGAELTVPPWMAKHRWELEHVGRVRVVVAEERMRVEPAQVEALRAGRNVTRTWLERGQSKEERRYRKLMMLVEEGADAYVLAEEDRDGGMIVVMPAARYREVTRR